MYDHDESNKDLINIPELELPGYATASAALTFHYRECLDI